MASVYDIEAIFDIAISLSYYIKEGRNSQMPQTWCPKCQGSLPLISAKFCPQCGSKTTVKYLPTCVFCKNELLDHHNFCSKCGRKRDREREVVLGPLPPSLLKRFLYWPFSARH